MARVCMSVNWIYSWPWCFSKIHRQFFHMENAAKITGKITTGPAVKNHVSSEMAKNWLQYIQLCKMCGSWFISELFLNFTFTYFIIIIIIIISGSRVWCQQIHRKSSTRKKWKNETPPKNWWIRRSTKTYIAWVAWLATGNDREFGWWKYFNRALVKPRVRKSRHFQVISMIRLCRLLPFPGTLQRAFDFRLPMLPRSLETAQFVRTLPTWRWLRLSRLTKLVDTWSHLGRRTRTPERSLPPTIWYTIPSTGHQKTEQERIENLTTAKASWSLSKKWLEPEWLRFSAPWHGVWCACINYRWKPCGPNSLGALAAGGAGSKA